MVSFFAIPSSTTRQIPGNGAGTSLTLLTTTQTDITAVVDSTTITVSSVRAGASDTIAPGMLLLTEDNRWGTFVDFPTYTTVSAAVTTSASADTLTKSSHGLVADDVVVVMPTSPNKVPAGITEGKAYFVYNVVGAAFQLSLQPSTGTPAAVNITGADTTVTVRKITTLNARVDKWRGSPVNGMATPAVANTSLSVYPAGSILATCNSVRVVSINQVKSTSAATTLAIHDGADSALFTLTSVVGQLPRYVFDDLRIRAPLTYVAGEVTNNLFLIEFEPLH